MSQSFPSKYSKTSFDRTAMGDRTISLYFHISFFSRQWKVVDRKWRVRSSFGSSSQTKEAAGFERRRVGPRPGVSVKTTLFYVTD
jgi:hypothetical protein